MLHSRIKRVENLLKGEIANIILLDLKDPRMRFVTVNAVKVSRDLQKAIVFVSVLSKEEEKVEATLEALERAKGYIKKLLSSRVVLKYMPNISFKRDRSYDHAEKIDTLLKEMHEKGDL
jgi:ribosome-binding factor A